MKDKTMNSFKTTLWIACVACALFIAPGHQVQAAKTSTSQRATLTGTTSVGDSVTVELYAVTTRTLLTPGQMTQDDGDWVACCQGAGCAASATGRNSEGLQTALECDCDRTNSTSQNQAMQEAFNDCVERYVN